MNQTILSDQRQSILNTNIMIIQMLIPKSSQVDWWQDPNPNFQVKHSQYYLEGSQVFLDNAGERAFDAADKMVYVSCQKEGQYSNRKLQDSFST